VSDLRLARINRVHLSGRVTRDFALRYAPDGTPVAIFSVAFNRWVKGEGGRWQELPSFIGVLTSGRLAERCSEHLRKGSALYLEGRLQSRSYRSPDGRSRSVIEIRADQVQFLEKEAGSPEEGEHAEAQTTSGRAEEGELFPEPEPED